MADINLEVGGDQSASQQEVTELEKELIGTQVETPTHEEHEEHEEHDDEDDHAGAAHEDERTGRVDAELRDAQNEEEREAIRARRRQERIDKKNRAREKVSSLERQVQQLARQNQEMAQQMAQFTQQSAGQQLTRLDEAITEVGQAVSYFEGVIAEATTKGDGEAVAKATSNLMAARERARDLTVYKEAMIKNSQTQRKQTLDPVMVDHAKKFMGEHKWYAGPRASDSDSRVLSAIDNAIAAEGWDPTGPEYWAELRQRAKKYLPHRFAGEGASATDKNNYNGRATGGKPNQPVAGNSGDASGPKGGGEGYTLSAERVKAIKDAGKWDDPKERAKMIQRYREYDGANKR